MYIRKYVQCQSMFVVDWCYKIKKIVVETAVVIVSLFQTRLQNKKKSKKFVSCKISTKLILHLSSVLCEDQG